jgi:hypothetical protein
VLLDGIFVLPLVASRQCFLDRCERRPFLVEVEATVRAKFLNVPAPSPVREPAEVSEDPESCVTARAAEAGDRHAIGDERGHPDDQHCRPLVRQEPELPLLRFELIGINPVIAADRGYDIDDPYGEPIQVQLIAEVIAGRHGGAA